MGALALRTRMLPPSFAKAVLHESGPPGERESFIERRSREPYLNGILNGKHMLAHHGSFLHQAYFNSRIISARFSPQCRLNSRLTSDELSYPTASNARYACVFCCTIRSRALLQNTSSGTTGLSGCRCLGVLLPGTRDRDLVQGLGATENTLPKIAESPFILEGGTRN